MQPGTAVRLIADPGRIVIVNGRAWSRCGNTYWQIQYPDRANFYPYQFKPVLNFLDSPGNGILIADEVGLGKTIEAGLIWTELPAKESQNDY